MRVIFSISVSVNVSQLLSNLNLYNTLLIYELYDFAWYQKRLLSLSEIGFDA